MLAVGVRARAPVAASSAEREHRVLHAPCSPRLAELLHGIATATISDVTTIVALGDYIPTRVKFEESEADVARSATTAG